MDERHQRREELLLDFHLDRIEPEDREWLTAQLRRDAELRAANDRLCRLLQPLDLWTLPPAPANLADRIIRNIERSKQEALTTTSIEQPAGHKPIFTLVGMDSAEPVERDSGARSWFFSMRELIAVAACIVMVFSVMVPGMRARSHKAMCQAGFHSIGQGLGMYGDVATASLPFADIFSRAPWLPSRSASAQQPTAHQSNSRHSYLLLKYGFVPSPHVFVCPASPDGRPMDPAAVASRNDFDGAYNNSYDALNMAGDNPPVRPSRQLVYLSDRSPIFLNGWFNEAVDPATTNSPTHGGKGQNVLRIDGSAEWTETPIYGPEKDNLWLQGERRRYDGTETSDDADDTFLIPGYPAGNSSEPANQAGQ